MGRKPRRVFGKKINFKSLACAPTNELGVVYLFGVLHEVFGLQIESIQSGFPDCIARRQIARDRWEEVRIEFEYESKTFLAHKHNPEAIDVIVCWKHNWPECPSHIEVIELSSQIANMEGIAKEIRTPKKLSAYNLFCREKRLEGLTFAEIATLWRKQKS
ncbi:hypothetical protein KAX21_02260 [candidate division WOR-3 bacterium]|nr:hypothetical protein [candidate division WOR-3 bacterium]